MAVEIADGLDLIGFAVQFHLVGLHHLLDGLPDVAQLDIYTGTLWTRGRQVLITRNDNSMTSVTGAVGIVTVYWIMYTRCK